MVRGSLGWRAAMVEIRPFTEELVDEAARLLAERHRRHRAAEPLLVERPDFAGEVRALVERGATGVAGSRDGRLVGYLLGTRLADEVWGPNIWVEQAGHAATDAEDVRDLYAEAAARWVEEGRTAHYALVPASDVALVDAWFRLSFGQQHALGVRELDAADDPAPPDTVVVRRATGDDLEALVELGPLLSDHQAQSPVFARGFDETEEELRTEIAADLANDSWTTLVAEVDGRIVSSFFLVPTEESGVHSGLARVPGALLLAWAATRPEARGTGAGLALMAVSFAHAREQGYTAMVVDWRVTNLLSSRFWTRRGFRPTFLRLHRLLDVR
jgi:ribosomal protein S18 acetylase RimI-like enzyme